MTELRISIFSETWVQRQPSFAPHSHQVIWLQSGTLSIHDQTIQADNGAYANNQSRITFSTDNAPRVIRFEVTPNATLTSKTTPSTNESNLLANTFTVKEDNAILRLDRVTFPANAVAYRHTHSGAGIRYLLCGQLAVAADAHAQLMNRGDAWFEDAYSPVKATAGAEGITEFVRVMVLPNEFLGKPTIKRLNPEDADKPTLQTNKRYFDLPISFNQS